MLILSGSVSLTLYCQVATSWPFPAKLGKNTIRSCDCILLSCDVHFNWITSSFSIKMSEHNPKNRLTDAGLSLLSLIKKVMAKTTCADLTIVIGVHVMSGPPPWYTYNHYITTCTIKKTVNRHQSPPSLCWQKYVDRNKISKQYLPQNETFYSAILQRNVDWEFWKCDWMAKLYRSGNIQLYFSCLNG